MAKIAPWLAMALFLALALGCGEDEDKTTTDTTNTDTTSETVGGDVATDASVDMGQPPDAPFVCGAGTCQPTQACVHSIGGACLVDRADPDGGCQSNDSYECVMLPAGCASCACAASASPYGDGCSCSEQVDRSLLFSCAMP